MGKVIINKTAQVKEEIEFAPCIKCGSHDVDFSDCGYSSFNIATGECKNKDCRYKVSFNCGCFPDKKWIIEQWNLANDIPTILIKKRLQLEVVQKEIADLESLHASRQ